jgi:ribosomal peptide maturation radical SAM protein 1
MATGESVPQNPVRIALVNMPFAMADRPSIQCGLLKACVERAGYGADVLYLNLEFAAKIGAELYRNISQTCRDDLLGEWLFSASIFDGLPDETEYYNTFSSLAESLKQWGVDFRHLCDLRNVIIPAWISHWLEEIDWGRYAIVGFTTTFEQNNPAFALARRIKERHPEIIIIFGGANFDGTMGREYMRAMPFIDYAVIGEGDNVLPQIIDCIARGDSPLGLSGVVGRRDGKLVDNGLSPRVENMDSLPDPDYDDYFATLSRLGTEVVFGKRPPLLGYWPPLLLVETSRGCWWGEKQHCTFCGLNGSGMKFRSKSPASAIGQLERLSSKYLISNFEAVDNILDHRYIEELCNSLAEHHYDYQIFYEVKANLRPSQLRAMLQAGISRIQPGIESLNSHILSLMRKGITMLRNVRLLKWAHYYGIQVSWNILTGFPGEAEADYAEQLQILPLLKHLPPPKGVSRIWLERFSPHFFDPSFPVRNAKPLSGYRFSYPEGRIDLNEIAYFFDYEMGDTLPRDQHQGLKAVINQWKEAWKGKPRPNLVYQRAPEWIQIVDRRTMDATVYSFKSWEADIYELCGEVERSPESISKHLAEKKGQGDVSTEEIRASLEKFCDLGLMLEERNSFLSLALPVNRHW